MIFKSRIIAIFVASIFLLMGLISLLLFFELYWKWRDCFNESGLCFDNETGVVFSEPIGLIFGGLTIFSFIILLAIFFSSKRFDDN